MSEQSMEELLAEAENTMPDIQERTVVEGTVIQVSRDEAYVEIKLPGATETDSAGQAAQ